MSTHTVPTGFVSFFSMSSSLIFFSHLKESPKSMSLRLRVSLVRKRKF
jgi:hypothetical protein